MAQPTMAPFICQQLIQQLVTSNPSPAYIQRVSKVFSNDGTGVAGNLQAVITAILMDPEARAADDPSAKVNPNFGHLREPVLFMANVLRGLDGTLGASSADLQQCLEYGRGSFLRPQRIQLFLAQYRTENNLLGPEFQIYSTQTVADRADIVNYDSLRQARCQHHLQPLALRERGGEDGSLLDSISYVFLHSSMSSSAAEQASPRRSMRPPRPRRRRRPHSTLCSLRASIRSFNKVRGESKCYHAEDLSESERATVGSLALRPFGRLPVLAQSGPDYRALVCVFLFGGNDSNNTIVPMDDTNFKAYQSIRGSLALTAAELTPVTSVSGAPYGFHAKLPEVASLFSSKELAIVANVGLPRAAADAGSVSETAGVDSAQPVLPSRPAGGMANFHRAGPQPHRLGRPCGGLHRRQKLNSSAFPAFFSVAGNALEGTGVNTQPVALGPGQSLPLSGFNTSAASVARMNALTSLLTTDTGVSLVQAANDTLAQSIGDATALTAALAKATALKTVFPTTCIGAAIAAGRPDHSGAVVSRHAAGRSSSARWAASIPTPGRSKRTTLCTRS